MELTGLQLQLFHDDATKYDLVTSDHALFDLNQKKLYSEGKVEITLAVPVTADGAPPAGKERLMYAWVWRHLPGPWPVRTLIALAFVAAIVVLLFTTVFPWAEDSLPFLKVTVDQ